MQTNATKTPVAEKKKPVVKPEPEEPINISKKEEPEVQETVSPIVPTMEKRKKNKKNYKSYTNFYNKEESKG